MTEKTTEDLGTTILTHVYSSPVFIPYGTDDLKGVSVDPKKEEPGLLQKIFLLSNLREWSGLKENEDDKLLMILDKIASKGLLNIYSVRSSNLLHHNDIEFKAYLGTARKTLGTSDVVVTNVRLHNKDSQSLSLEEMRDSQSIVNVKERVQGIRKRRDRAFSISMGNPTDPLEREKEKKTEEAYIKAQWQWRRDIGELSKNIKTLSADIRTLLEILNSPEEKEKEIEKKSEDKKEKK